MDDHLFQLNAEETNGILIVHVSGRVDSVNAEQFHSSLATTIHEPETDLPVALDFEKLDFISSAGLRTILQVAKQLGGNQQKFALFSLTASVMEIFQLSGFDRIVDIHDSRNAAIAAVSQ